MERRFHRIDLHVHSPASSDYRGRTEEKEYLRILKQAKRKGLSAIAITDHNSIEGYKRLGEIKAELMRKRDSLRASSGVAAKTQELEKLNRELRLFEEIAIFPGVEFETLNGIHLLVVFSFATPPQVIEQFLYEGGYDRENFGKRDPNIRIQWDVTNLYEETKKYDCIVIDAHTDSDKGILNTVPKSAYRARCFKDEQLIAIAYKSEKQKDQLHETLKTSLDYRRDTPVAFVKFSDAHAYLEVGRSTTWIGAETITLKAIKEAFRNPAECVSIHFPHINTILDRLAHQETSFGIQDFSETEKDKLIKAICALNNTDGGFCLIGLDEKKNKVGLACEFDNEQVAKQTLEGCFSELHQVFDRIDGPVIWNARPYPLQEDKIVIALQIKKSDYLVCIKDKGNIYYVQNNQVSVLSAKQVQKLIESRHESYIHTRIEKTIAIIQGECSRMKSFFSSLPVLRKFEECSVLLIEVVKGPFVKESIRLKDSDRVNLLKLHTKCQHGRCRGNITYVEGVEQPRLRDAYLRYSLPVFNAGFAEKPSDGETIYICPGGSVYFAKREYPFFSESSLPMLIASSAQPKIYSNAFIVCFLKSSFWLWYLMQKHGEMDIMELHPGMLRMPRLNRKILEINRIVRAIEDNFSAIISQEKAFLKGRGTYSKNPDFVEKLDREIDAHNKSVGLLAYEIDKNIYQLLNLTDQEIEVIESSLRGNHIFLPVSRK